MVTEKFDNKSADSKAAIITAVYRDRASTVALLIKAGISPDIRIGIDGSPCFNSPHTKKEWLINPQNCIDNATLLMAASEDGLDATVESLILGGASLELKDRNNWTALMYAAANNRMECVRKLLKAGADPNAAFIRKNVVASGLSGETKASTITLQAVTVLDIAKPDVAPILRAAGAKNGGKPHVLVDDLHIFDNKQPCLQNKHFR
jgi:ankyrin repeat protein